MADDLDRNSSEEEASQSSKKMITIITSVIVLIIVAVLGGMFASDFFDETFDEKSDPIEMQQSSDEVSGGLWGFFSDEAESMPERLYWPLNPSFVLNFEGGSKARYMQIGLEVALSNDKAYAALKKHIPVIRNEIVLLLSGQKYQELVTPEGKEQLRAELIETINNILKQHKVKKGIDNIYFTSFVMQ